jgi:hypothetical protein
MIYTHLMEKAASRVRSPLDGVAAGSATEAVRITVGKVRKVARVVGE